jgi:hypothetical protein
MSSGILERARDPVERGRGHGQHSQPRAGEAENDRRPAARQDLRLGHRPHQVDRAQREGLRHERRPHGDDRHGKGIEAGQFLFPTYLILDGQGNLYVTDTLNSRIEMFDPDGKYIRSFGQRGSAWGMFDKPKGVALDSFGNLYVVDSGWSNVQIFNAKGQVLLFFGGRGPIPGMLKNPTAVAIDRTNRIYVADYLNHRVEEYRLVNTRGEDSFLNPAIATKGGDPDPSPRVMRGIGETAQRAWGGVAPPYESPS